MIDKVKSEIETLGFNQMIEGVMRTWPGQPNFNIDHCWLNIPWRLISYKNVERAFSDHNLVLVNLRMSTSSKGEIEMEWTFRTIKIELLQLIGHNLTVVITWTY